MAVTEGQTYRNWLQALTDAGNREASAVLQVVGDDYNVNPGFIEDPYAYTGNEQGWVYSTVNPTGENTGYGPQGIQSLNDKFSSIYRSQLSQLPSGQTYQGIDNNLAGFEAEKSGILSSALGSAEAGKLQAGSDITNYLYGQGNVQRDIDLSAAKNELAKMQGVSGTQGMVNRGIRSGGVMLGNRNAGDSSAMGEMANAYGQMGQRNLSDIGNQYALGNEDINLQQQNLGGALNLYQQNWATNKEKLATDIMREAGNSLSNLDARMAAADLPGRIAIEQEKQNIKAQALAKLSELDTTLSGGLAGIKPAGREANITKARELMGAGTNLGEGAFKYTTEAPAQLQGQNSIAGSGFPLYTYKKNKTY